MTIQCEEGCPTAIELGEDLIAFPKLFRRQVELTPNRLAVVHEDRELSYRDLDDLANRYASMLNARGVRQGSFVGLCLDRSPEAIAAMIGVLASGAAFVPLDPEYPVDRLAYMVEDASISVIIAQSEYRQLLEPGLADVAHEIHWVEDVPTGDKNQVIDNDVAPNDLAYVMYTSGSTGKPKGVQIDHAALATYCFADIDVYQVNSNDRTLQFSTLNFDIAIEEIYPPLLTGSAIVIRPLGRSDQHNELSDIVIKHDVTAIHLATAYWHQWVDLMVASGDRVPESIRLMIVTGEKVSVEHYRRWQSICDHEVLWCNAYGPTEATVSATVFIPDESFDAPSMPIGKPLKRYDAFILDDQLNEIPQLKDGVSETGQLFIGGPALARGYLNRPDLTEKAFVTTTLSDGSPRRLYRTGDLSRWLGNGDIEFAGRIDHQIKLGSYRIEPGEIEAALDQHPQVFESLVSFDEIEGKKFLIAYVAIGNNDPTAGELANFLRDHLPPYMIPARYVFVGEFPKTINGKIDRKALPDSSKSVVARDSSFVAPRNELETRLAELFQDVLNVPEVGIHDDFFLMGGSSLLVTQVVANLTGELKIELPVRDFFANPTVAMAAKHIQRLQGIETDDEQDAAAMRERLPKIHADFIDGDHGRLYSVRYQPKPDSQRRHGVVFCNALGHEYSRSYRNLQQFSVQLCQSGFDVLRFDYAGTGNSEGECVDAVAQRMQDDIRTACGFLRAATSCDQLTIVGIRLGATLAAATKTGADNVILWDPVVDGEQMLRMLTQFHDHALESQFYFPCRRERSDIDQLFGHEMTVDKRESLAQLRLPNPEDVPTNHLVVTSQGYLDAEAGLSERGWNVQQVDDSIYWHDSQFTESAFSSPQSYRAMMEFLTGTKPSMGASS